MCRPMYISAYLSLLFLSAVVCRKYIVIISSHFSYDFFAKG